MTERPRKHLPLALLGALLVTPVAATTGERAEATAACPPNRAVYAAPDGTEFVSRHYGTGGRDARGNIYLEGFLRGVPQYFVGRENNEPTALVGAFDGTTSENYERASRYEIEWSESPDREAPLLLVELRRNAPALELTRVACDGRSATAAQRIAQPLASCPADRLLFVDEISGAEFTADAYAEDFRYLYYAENDFGPGEKAVESARPPPDRDRQGQPYWQKKFGYYLLRGRMRGAEVYLMYEQIIGVPCCTFHSFYPGSPDIKRLKLPSRVSSAPVVSDDNKDRYTAERVDSPYPFFGGSGPLAGMRLVPVACSTKTRATR